MEGDDNDCKFFPNMKTDVGSNIFNFFGYFI